MDRAIAAPYPLEPGREPIRRASTATLVAIFTLVASGVALALFFGGAGAVFGPVNDVLLGATFVLLVPAILASRRLAAGRSPWVPRMAWIGLAGVAELVVGQVLLVTGVISLAVSFATLTIGILGFLAWAGAVSIAAWRGALFSRALGVWFGTFVGSFVLAAAGWPLLPMAIWSVLGVALLVTFVGWLVVLARDLRRAALAT